MHAGAQSSRNQVPWERVTVLKGRVFVEAPGCQEDEQSSDALLLSLSDAVVHPDGHGDERFQILREPGGPLLDLRVCSGRRSICCNLCCSHAKLDGVAVHLMVVFPHLHQSPKIQRKEFLNSVSEWQMTFSWSPGCSSTR